MKKLLVFLSIFAVLFVSTIRPLHAEFIDDNFTLVNGITYYFVIDEQALIDEYTIALNQNYPSATIILRYNNDYKVLFFEVQVVPQAGGGATADYYSIPLTFLGPINDYVTPNVTINGFVYSFVWTPPTCSTFEYDDWLLAFDTENPLPPISIYDTIYSLVNKYVFGNNIESGSHQDLTATILSTTICVLVFALPFLIIWKVIKIIMG